MFKGWSNFEKYLLIVATVIIFCLSLYWGDTFLGITGAVTGVICVILTAKGKLSCYAFGLVNILIYIFIALNQKFYGEVMLNVLYYLPMQFIGFYMWKKAINTDTEEVKALRLSRTNGVSIIIGTIAMILAYGGILKSIGGNLPYVDAMSTVLSIVAMLLSVKRFMEQWICWIVVDVVSIIMWVVALTQGSNDMATLLMWTVYLINAVYGYIKWKKLSE